MALLRLLLAPALVLGQATFFNDLRNQPRSRGSPLTQAPNGIGGLAAKTAQACQVFGSYGKCLPKFMCKPPMGYTDTVRTACNIPGTVCCYDALSAYKKPSQPRQPTGANQVNMVRPGQIPYPPGTPFRGCIPYNAPDTRGECMPPTYCEPPKVISRSDQCDMDAGSQCCYIPPPRTANLCFPGGKNEFPGICIENSQCKPPRILMAGLCPNDPVGISCCYMNDQPTQEPSYYDTYMQDWWGRYLGEAPPNAGEGEGERREEGEGGDGDDGNSGPTIMYHPPRRHSLTTMSPLFTLEKSY
eukprot:g13963.t1